MGSTNFGRTKNTLLRVALASHDVGIGRRMILVKSDLGASPLASITSCKTRSMVPYPRIDGHVCTGILAQQLLPLSSQLEGGCTVPDYLGLTVVHGDTRVTEPGNTMAQEKEEAILSYRIYGDPEMPDDDNQYSEDEFNSKFSSSDTEEDEFSVHGDEDCFDEDVSNKFENNTVGGEDEMESFHADEVVQSDDASHGARHG